MLHLIFQAPLEPAVLERIDVGDAVIFMGPATLLTLAQSALAPKLAAMAKTRILRVLSDDMIMRGIAPEDLTAGVVVIDDTGFVALTLEHKVIQSWY